MSRWATRISKSSPSESLLRVRQLAPSSATSDQQPVIGDQKFTHTESHEGPVISCRGLRKTYPGGFEALRGVDLEVPQGECFGLLGPNGAGKTTSIEILEGLRKSTAGEVLIFGEPWGKNDHALRQRMGISLQETRLSEKLTVLETLRLFRSFYSQGFSVEEILTLVSLEGSRDQLVGTLSGGQHQRLGLACALVGNPGLLFLDEPTTGLDPGSRRQVWDLIRQSRELGCTVFLTTHYMEEAERLCDRVAILDQGRLIAQDTPAALVDTLRGKHVIEFSVRKKKEPSQAVHGNGNGVGGDPSLLEELLPSLEKSEAIGAIRPEGGRLAMTVNEPQTILGVLLQLLNQRNLEISSLSTRNTCLEDVFVSLTGRHSNGVNGSGSGKNDPPQRDSKAHDLDVPSGL